MHPTKPKPSKGAWRIQERTLFIVALCGGAIGIFIGSQLFRHKTQKKRFKYGIPLILLLQLIVRQRDVFLSISTRDNKRFLILKA